MALDAMNSAPTVAPPCSKTRRLDDVVVDSWKTSKRSKRQRLSKSEDEYLAVCLVMLARSGGGPYPSSSADHSITEEIKQDDKPFAAAASPSTGATEKDDKPAVPVTATSTAALPDADVTNNKDSAPTTPPSPPPFVATSYRCSVCDKAFSSYQALGGHKASHRTKPSTAAAIASEKESPCADIPAVKPSGRLHECQICHKSFTSGQALGGHKRKHYEGVIGNGAAAKSRTTSSSGGSASDRAALSAAVIRDFDLNMPPPLEFLCDEEVESALPPLFE